MARIKRQILDNGIYHIIGEHLRFFVITPCQQVGFPHFFPIDTPRDML